MTTALALAAPAQAQPAAGAPAADPNAPVAQPAPSVIVLQQQAQPAPTAPQYSNMKGGEWEPGDPVPPGYHPEGEIRQGLTIAGAVTLGTTWLLLGVLPGALILGACADFGSSSGDCGVGGTLLIPAIGPFVSMPFAAGEEYGGTAIALLAVDGVVQSGGAVMLILGLALQKDVLVKDASIGDMHFQIKPTPMNVGDSGHGFGVVGTF